MSLNLTYNALSRNATAIPKVKSCAMRGMIHSADQVRLTPLRIIKTPTTTRLIAKLIKAEKEPANIITYLGKESFLIKSPLLTIDDKPCVVTSTK